MANRWTKEQKQAIDARGSDLLIAAAAGSGKTAVLVERIITKLLREEQEIDRLLVVTFTNAAAAQMRERITKALSDRVEAEPDNEHIKKQLMLIHNAKIMTIHSFCLYLIKNHFNDIGLDPDFRTADEGEIRLLKQEVLSELLEEQFALGRQEFTDCVEYFAYDGREKRLEELIERLYTFSGSYPFPEKWLRQHRMDYHVETFEELVKRMVTDLGDDDQECHAEASSWMAACVSLTFTGATFLSYLDSRHELWDAIGIHNSLQDCVSDLNNNDPVDQIDIRKNIVYLSAKLREHYYCYQTWYGDKCVDKTLAAGMARILAWRKRKWDLVKC